MALVPCPECGSKISQTATACPQCGRSFSAEELAAALSNYSKKTKNGKVLEVVGVLLVIVSIPSCLYAGNYAKGGMGVSMLMFIGGWILFSMGRKRQK